MIRRLLRDTRGEIISNSFTFVPTFFLATSTFLLEVQVDRIYTQRDTVDHCAKVAADTAMKNWADGEGTAKSAAIESIRADLQAAGADGNIDVEIKPESGGADDPGVEPLRVTVKARFDCALPFASTILCKGGSVDMEASELAMAMGCDGKP